MQKSTQNLNKTYGSKDGVTTKLSTPFLSIDTYGNDLFKDKKIIGKWENAKDSKKVIFVATEKSGLWKSIDNGKTYTFVIFGIMGMTIHQMITGKRNSCAYFSATDTDDVDSLWYIDEDIIVKKLDFNPSELCSDAKSFKIRGIYYDDYTLYFYDYEASQEPQTFYN